MAFRQIEAAEVHHFPAQVMVQNVLIATEFHCACKRLFFCSRLYKTLNRFAQTTVLRGGHVLTLRQLVRYISVTFHVATLRCFSVFVLRD